MLGGHSEMELQGGTTKLGPSSFFNYVFNTRFYRKIC